MEGFSDTLLNNHFTLYQGYVTNTNKLLDICAGLKDEKAATPEFAELNRRWAGVQRHAPARVLLREPRRQRGIADGRLAKRLQDVREL